MSNESGYTPKKITAGTIIAPIITLALLFVFWRLGQKWVIIPAIVFLLFFYLLMPRIIRARTEKFHRAALKLLATGKAAEVPALARKQLLLQLFAPSAPIDAKLGLAYSHMGDHAAAVSHLFNAVASAPPEEKPVLQAALAKGLLITGDPARAEAEAQALLNEGTRLPETLVVIARARVGLGKTDSHTMKYLDEAEQLVPTEDLSTMIALTRIEAAMATGRKPDEIPDGADSDNRFLRVWINLVRGRLRERKGDPKAAAESYARAVREGAEERCWFADMAHASLGRLEKSKGAPAQQGNAQGMDPSVRRKKKKRR